MIFISLLATAEVQTQIPHPIGSIDQIVNDSDLECLHPNDEAFTISENLKYVGMLSSMGTDTFNFDQWKSDVRATLKMGNLQVIEYLDLGKTFSLNDSCRLFGKKLRFVSKHNVEIVVVLQNLFFDENGKLKSDYVKSWKKLQFVLAPYKKHIKGFYIFDEPFWNVELNKRNGNKDYVTAEEMDHNLTEVGNLLHKSTPSIPLIYIEAYTMINEALKIPAVFDWIGMDCYTGFDNCQGKSIPEYYQILKKLQPGKKLVVLPPAIIFKKPEDITLEDRKYLQNIYTKFINWVATEPNIILSLSFMYRFDQTNEVFTGSDKLCEVADSHRLYWRKFYQSIQGIK